MRGGYESTHNENLLKEYQKLTSLSNKIFYEAINQIFGTRRLVIKSPTTKIINCFINKLSNHINHNRIKAILKEHQNICRKSLKYEKKSRDQKERMN